MRKKGRARRWMEMCGEMQINVDAHGPKKTNKNKKNIGGACFRPRTKVPFMPGCCQLLRALTIWHHLI